MTRTYILKSTVFGITEERQETRIPVLYNLPNPKAQTRFRQYCISQSTTSLHLSQVSFACSYSNLAGYKRCLILLYSDSQYSILRGFAERFPPDLNKFSLENEQGSLVTRVIFLLCNSRSSNLYKFCIVDVEPLNLLCWKV